MASVARIRKVPGAASSAEAARKARGDQPGASRATPADPKAPADLDDLETQQEILDPKPLEVTIGGAPILLHPLPALVARQYAGLFAQILSESTRQSGVTSMRIAGVLIENSEYVRKFCGYVARATFPTADVPTVQDLAAEAARIETSASYPEFVGLFAQMSTLNKTGDVFAPK